MKKVVFIVLFLACLANAQEWLLTSTGGYKDFTTARDSVLITFPNWVSGWVTIAHGLELQNKDTSIVIDSMWVRPVVGGFKQYQYGTTGDSVLRPFDDFRVPFNASYDVLGNGTAFSSGGTGTQIKTLTVNHSGTYQTLRDNYSTDSSKFLDSAAFSSTLNYIGSADKRTRPNAIQFNSVFLPLCRGMYVYGKFQDTTRLRYQVYYK